VCARVPLFAFFHLANAAFITPKTLLALRASDHEDPDSKVRFIDVTKVLVVPRVEPRKGFSIPLAPFNGSRSAAVVIDGHMMNMDIDVSTEAESSSAACSVRLRTRS